MKNSTLSIASDRPAPGREEPGQLQISGYPSTDQRVRLRWIGPDPARAIDSSRTDHRNQLQERFFAMSMDMLCTIDSEGRYVSVSPACEQLLGYKPEEMEGRYAAEFLVPEDTGTSAAIRRAAILGADCRNFENRYVAKDGSIVNMAWSGRWSEEDGLIYCIGRDDRDKKAVEMELHKLNESLEQKIVERTTQLERSNKELEAFSYSVSHDLRAPLRIINGYTRLLSTAKEHDPESKEFIDAILESTRYMSALIDDLLNLSRLDKEAVNLMEVDMDFVARLTLNQMAAEDPALSTQIQIHPLRSAVCDSSLIKQVWTNLLSNAVKYSRKKENPQIEVGCYETDTSIVYYVKDNGAGFDMKFAAKLFGVFVRLHNRSEFEGTGVGLAIVNRIISKHNGKVWANGKVDEGAVFYFSLPKGATSVA